MNSRYDLNQIPISCLTLNNLDKSSLVVNLTDSVGMFPLLKSYVLPEVSKSYVWPEVWKSYVWLEVWKSYIWPQVWKSYVWPDRPSVQLV